MALAAPDERAFRATLSKFPVGVAVVTTLDRGRPRGMTVTAFAGVSTQPPLVLLWVGGSFPLSVDGRFAVSVLAHHQLHLALRFAEGGRRPARDPFDATAWWPARASGSPVLSGTVAWFDCVVGEVKRCATHAAVVGQVHDVGHVDEVPLLHVNHGYRGLDRPVPPPLFPGATREAGNDGRLSLVRYG